jgi:hypothetical protein
MSAFLYRCPATGMMVQGWRADDGAAADGDDNYVSMRCLACNRVHLINPVTGVVFGGEEDRG